MVFRPAKDWFSHPEHIELVVSAQPTLVRVNAPADSSGQKFGADFVAVWVAKDSEQISRLSRDFEPGRIENVWCRAGGLVPFDSTTYNRPGAQEEEDTKDEATDGLQARLP